MTVGIASMCECLTKIVTVADAMLDFGDVAVDGVSEKIAPIHPNWFSLYASNDTTDVRPILELVTVQLCSEKRELFMTDVGNAFARAYAIRNQRMVEQKLIEPRGFKHLDDFYDRGKSVLTESEFNRLSREIDKITPSSEFLIGGFDQGGIGHILLQKPRSAYECLDDPGFWAIGSGAPEAISGLLFQADKLGFDLMCSEGECVYHLLSAKFTAESNRRIGRDTFVVVREFGKGPRHLPLEAVDTIRKAWYRHSIPKLPRRLVGEIPKMMKESKPINRENIGRAYRRFSKRLRER